jgi:hypothetical protein
VEQCRRFFHQLPLASGLGRKKPQAKPVWIDVILIGLAGPIIHFLYEGANDF